MASQPELFIGNSDTPQYLLLKNANRHGLIAGATGTGKTVTLQSLAENFSRNGVPVFLADVKGDLAGISQPGSNNEKVAEQVKQLGMSDFSFEATPTIFWDIFGQQGHPVRTTVTDFGPVLFGRLLGLNDAQVGVLQIVFRIADDQGMLLLDLKDLRAVLEDIAEHAAEFTTSYGNVSKASVGAIQRALLTLEQQGGEYFFGEPAIDINDFMRTTPDGRGFISILAADKLMQSPQLYATFLLWMLSELFEQLPEAGDIAKPKLVFFFDEAHILFDDAPKVLIDKVEQVVRIIRSKGVGVYFISQNPLDIPEDILGQLGNRVQHALRAFTPRDQKAVRSAAETFRANPKLDTTTVITELGIGEALVSTLNDKGVPVPVERVLIAPPRSRLGPVTPNERQLVSARSPVKGRYDSPVDRESAYEILKRRTASHQPVATTNAQREKPKRDDSVLGIGQELFGVVGKALLRSVGSSLGRKVARGLLGSITKN